MDNRNTGKLIASLRKKLGMTQQELGDKIGVGFRAVSKWERGLNLPDISNMNELSKILGITLDELMSGELNNEKHKTENKSSKTKIKTTISIITSIIIITIFSLIYFNNKTDIYSLLSVNIDEYTVEGEIKFKGDKMNIVINNLRFKDKGFSSIKTKNYEYTITSNEIMLFGYGQNNQGDYLEKEITIEKFAESFSIDFLGNTKISKKEIIRQGLILNINFTTIDNINITTSIELKISNYKKFKI